MNLAVFASGNGSNFAAIQKAIEEGRIDGQIKILVVDKKDAYAIERAKKYNIEYFAFNAKDYPSKNAYEKEISNLLNEKKVDLVILAGYMRIIGKRLLKDFDNKIINIHPSLLPAFKGKDAIGQAINYGVKVMGVSIHYVNSELDGGSIIAQEAFNVGNLNKTQIEEEIHKIEHRLYPKVIQDLIKERSDEKKSIN